MSKLVRWQRVSDSPAADERQIRAATAQLGECFNLCQEPCCTGGDPYDAAPCIRRVGHAGVCSCGGR